MSTVALSSRISDPQVASAAQTDFPAGFPLPAADSGGGYSSVVVHRVRAGVSAVLVHGTDFSVINITDGDFTARLNAGATAGDVIRVVGLIKPARASTYRPGSLDSAALERELTRVVQVAQEHNRDIGRAAKAVYGEAGPELPTEAARAGKIAVWSNDGKTMRTDRALTAFDQDVSDTAAAADLAGDYRREAGEILVDCQTVATDVTNKRNTVVTRANEVAANKTDIDAALSAIETLLGDTEVATLPEVIAAVGANAAQVSDDKNAVATLKSDVEGLKTDTQGIKDDVVAVQADINANIGDLGGLTVGEAVAQVAADKGASQTNVGYAQTAQTQSEQARDQAIFAASAIAGTVNAAGLDLYGPHEFWIADELDPAREYLTFYLEHGTGRGMFKALAVGEQPDAPKPLNAYRFMDYMAIDGQLIWGMDYAKRFRLPLDQWSIDYITERQTGSGTIAPEDMPLVGVFPANLGFRGSTYHTLWSDEFIGVSVQYRYNFNTADMVAVTARGFLYVTIGGQSLGEGSTGATGITAGSVTVNPYAPHLKTFNDGNKCRGPSASAYTPGSVHSLIPAVELGVGGTPNTGAVNGGLCHTRNSVVNQVPPRPILIRGHAIAGQAISVLKYGGTGAAFQNSMDQAADAASLVASQYGMKITSSFEAWLHGEANRTAGSSYAYYYGELEAYEAAMQAHRKPLLPDLTDDIKLIIAGLASRGTNVEGGVSVIGQAQLDFALANANTAYACPGYLFKQVDGIHTYPEGGNHKWEYIFKTWADWEATGVKPLPCYVKDVSYSASGGHHLDCRLHVPVGSLRNLTIDNGGFLPVHPTGGTAVGSGNGETITAMPEVIGRDVVRIPLSAAPGSARWVSFGYNEGGGYCADEYPFSFSTFCDEDPRRSRQFPSRGLFNYVASTRIEY